MSKKNAKIYMGVIIQNTVIVTERDFHENSNEFKKENAQVKYKIGTNNEDIKIGKN